ncbi:MAG: amidohydrolase [Lachnospiraceae bacterium]|nr:amidohydrolase [Lachnospiraceae bacterium]
MRIRFYNARIITMKENDTLQKGELHVENDRIIYIGEGKEPGQEGWDREIDCEGNLLLPGFKNAHTHSAMTFLRSYADDLPLQEWLYQQVFPMEAKLTKEDQKALAELGMLEYLTSGITANFDMYLDNMCHAQASKDLGFRTVLCGSMNDFGGTVAETEEEYYKINEVSPLVSYKLGFHAEYTTKGETIEELARLAGKMKEPVYLHLSETKKEVEECYGRYQMSPVKYLDSVGIFEYGGGGFHGVWMNEEDMDICARKKVSIVSNPASNAKLASGIADLCALTAKGINVALGTDGPASNNALDMFREMYLASVLPKLSNMDAAAMDAAGVLKMATVGGAIAMGLTDCDVLAEGKKADIIMLDMHRPNMQPENNIIKNIVYSGSKENVKMTMIDGKILYENGEFFVGREPEEIYQKANAIINRMR